MNRSIWLPDDLGAAAKAAGLDVPAICREAIRDALDGQAPIGSRHRAHQLDEHEHPDTAKQLRALTAGLSVAGGVAVLALILAAVALRTR